MLYIKKYPGRKEFICGYQDILCILLYLAAWVGYMRASTVPSGQKNGRTEAFFMVRSAQFMEPEVSQSDFISAHTDATFTWWQIFLVAFLGSIVLEYGTSWALEKLFHAYWWDYSSMPLNINGRVCFPYSVGFGVAGLIVVYFIAPFTNLTSRKLSDHFLPLYLFFSSSLAGYYHS